MQLNITFRGMEPTEALKTHIHDRVEHLSRYFDRPIEAHAVLSLERYLQHVDLTLQAGPYLLRGKAKSEDMYKSIDEVVEKIERQLKRYRGRLRSQKLRDAQEVRKVRHDIVSVRAPEEDENETWTQGPKLIRSKEFPVHAMSIDEAIMQMDLAHTEFFVFINSGTNLMGVVYRRTDGHFGLIESPAAA